MAAVALRRCAQRSLLGKLRKIEHDTPGCTGGMMLGCGEAHPARVSLRGRVDGKPETDAWETPAVEEVVLGAASEVGPCSAAGQTVE